MHVSPLPDEISTKFQSLYISCQGPAIDWDPREYYAIKPEVDKTSMAASKLKMHISPLTYQISAKFQRLYLYFRGPASRWYPREYYATKPEVEYSNMAASILEVHVSPLPDKISRCPSFATPTHILLYSTLPCILYTTHIYNLYTIYFTLPYRTLYIPYILYLKHNHITLPTTYTLPILNSTHTLPHHKPYPTLHIPYLT